MSNERRLTCLMHILNAIDIQRLNNGDVDLKLIIDFKYVNNSILAV